MMPVMDTATYHHNTGFPAAWARASTLGSVRARVPGAPALEDAAMNMNAIHDLVYYLFDLSGASNDKANGVIVGLVGTLCASMTFEAACKIVAESIKHMKAKYTEERFRMECIPECWRSEIEKHSS
jgi:hypothetical protein